MEQKVSMGRIVIYKDLFFNEFPAIVTRVKEYSVDLAVFQSEITATFYAKSIRFGTDNNNWHWPDRV